MLCWGDPIFGVALKSLLLFHLIDINKLLVSNCNNHLCIRRADEKSAYSVFNPNCEAIHGSIKSEDIMPGVKTTK